MSGLSNVTLCVVTSRDLAVSELALQRSARDLRFGQVVLFSPDRPSDPGIRHVPIRRFARNKDYDHFVLAELGRHIETDFALIIHFDGFVINPGAWRDDFLEYDYIGARWPWQPHAPVGNGGFCLRSARLLRITAESRFIREDHPEDIVICREERGYLESRHGIRFAPPDVADRFSVEHSAVPTGSFGFHGLFHLHRVYPDSEIDRVLSLMNPAVYAGAQALFWFLTLQQEGGHRILGRLAKAIVDAQPSDVLARNCAAFRVSPVDAALALARAVGRG